LPTSNYGKAYTFFKADKDNFAANYYTLNGVAIDK